VAAGGRVEVYSHTGSHLQTLPGKVKACILLRTKNALVFGFENGSIESHRPGLRRPTSLRFVSTPSSQVVSLLEGPRGTLIAGFASGLVGIWHARDGKLLTTTKLHGPAVHLVIHEQKLYAATELGGHRVLDLKSFYTSRCDLLRDVWQKTPTVWEDGHPRLQPPSPDHACAKGTPGR
jgi:hypothetical protein